MGKLRFWWSWFVAGLILLLVGAPSLIVARLANRRHWVYPFADWGARTWLRLCGVDVKVRGLEHLDPKQSYVFVSNHRSYLDASPLFCNTGRRMGVVAKKELLKVPVLGYGMDFVNVISIDRSNRQRAMESMRIATERLRAGISFAVCAEGTRARPGEMLPFKKGAFYMAVEAGVPIVPLALKNSDRLMGKGTGVAWPGTIEMVVMPPVETAGVSDDEGVQALVHQVQEMVRKELGVEKVSARRSK